MKIWTCAATVIPSASWRMAERPELPLIVLSRAGTSRMSIVAYVLIILSAPGGFFMKAPMLIAGIICIIAAGIIRYSETRPIKQKQNQNPLTVRPTQTIPILPSITTTPTKKIVRISPTVQANSSPTQIPETAPSVTQQATATTHLEISQPGQTITIDLDYHGNENPCSLLTNAKNAGKINSVTIQHYGPPLNSDYVKEINGYQDNWTFKMNGEGKPKGCSNYSLNRGDRIEWKYN